MRRRASGPRGGRSGSSSSGDSAQRAAAGRSMTATSDAAAGLARREGDRIALPGLATAHSHAFQRAIRGRTHRSAGAVGSFWSWRESMYGVAAKLDPETIFAVSRFAFAELALAGVTA